MADVVGLEPAFHHHLPVGGDTDLAFVVQHMAAKAKAVEIVADAAEETVEIVSLTRAGDHEDQPEGLGNRQAAQAMGRLVQAGKAVLVRDAAPGTPPCVGPNRKS